jgi:hypothetical protein
VEFEQQGQTRAEYGEALINHAFFGSGSAARSILPGNASNAEVFLNGRGDLEGGARKLVLQSRDSGVELFVSLMDAYRYLSKDSEQLNWLNAQLMNLPKSTRFVIISLHHPPVADFQTRINVSHNPRPNEIALRDDLEALAPRINAKIIVSAGHIHNYERFSQNGVTFRTFLVAGGGATSPVEVERAPRRERPPRITSTDLTPRRVMGCSPRQYGRGRIPASSRRERKDTRANRLEPIAG